MSLRRSQLDTLLQPDAFLWATGIEDTFITDPWPTTGRTLDEYELTGHYERRREDINLMASLGVKTVRYGIPWHRINPAPKAWNWSFPDEALEHLLQVGIDPNSSSSGARSLRMKFQARSNLDQFDVSQLVAVQPKTEYELTFDLSTGKLETGSAPLVQILDATTGAELLQTPQAPNGTNAWNRVNYTFKTGEKTEGILLRIVRVSCSTDETPVCPIFGSVWYDDFSFKRRN